MKTLKRIIIALFIFVIILIFILIFFIKYENENNTENVISSPISQIIEERPIEEVFDEANKIKTITTKSQYFNVKSCIEKYKTLLITLNNEKQEKDESLVKLKNIIPDFVKEELELTDDNIISKIGIPNCIVKIDSIYMSQQTINKQAYIEKTNINAYIANGTLINPNNSSQKREFEIIVVLDERNMRFFVIPQEYILKKEISLEQGENLKIYQEDEIPDNEYNKFSFSQNTEEDLAVEFFNLSKYYLDYDIDYIYNRMSEEYRNKRFGTIEEYREYIKANIDELKSASAEQYLRNQNGEVAQYIIKDQFQNLYIFEAKNPLDYTIKLDTYTIDEEKFITEYNKASFNKKVQMNIDKFFQMINRHDYKTSYNCLATSFKNKNNITQEEFEKMAKKDFWKYNKIEFLKFEEVGNNTYIYNIGLKDLTEEQSETKKITVIMKLNNNMSFEMSFSTTD